MSLLQTLNNFGQRTSSGIFKSFDMKICSMLLYGCEVWGTQQFENIERIQYYACKRLMNVQDLFHVYFNKCEFQFLRLHINTTNTICFLVDNGRVTDTTK